MTVDEKGLERVARALCRSKQSWGDTAAVTEQYVDTFWRDYLPDAKVAITAYEAAKTAEGPVAWPDVFRVRAHGNWLYFTDHETAHGSAEMHGTTAEPLYAAPPPPQVTHE